MSESRDLLASHVVLACAVLVTACRSESPYCDDQITELSSLEEPSPTDVRGADVLAPAAGSHVVTMDYHQPSGDNPFVDVAPPDLQTELTIEITYDDGGLRFVDAEAVYPPRSPPIAISCSDRIEVDAILDLHSADGLLDERWPVTLVRATDEGDSDEDPHTTLTVDVDMDALMGSMEVVDITPDNPDELDHWLTMHLFHYDEPAPDGATWRVDGELGGRAVYERGDITQASVFTIASWSGHSP